VYVCENNHCEWGAVVRMWLSLVLVIGSRGIGHLERSPDRRVTLGV
jgi:hypothetical protein